MKTCKNMLSLLLVFLMLLSAAPLSAFAASAPVISVSSDKVTIDRSVSSSATVKMSCKNPPSVDWYWNLAAAGPFVCEWNEDESFVINATGTGTAELDVLICRDDNDEVLAARTIQVTVVDGTGDKEAQLYQEYKNAQANRDFRANAASLKATVQLYKLKATKYTGKDGKPHTLYEYDTGICNFSSAITLLNRAIGFYLKDYSSPVTPEKLLEAYGKKITATYYFSSKDSYTKVYLRDGNQTDSKQDDLHKALKSASGNLKRTGYVMPGTKTDEYRTYKYGGKTFAIKGFKNSTEMSKYKSPAKLAELLRKHPEGIYIHYKNSKGQHAVLVVDYSYANGKYTFTIIDPARSGKVQGPRTYTKTVSSDSDIIADTHSGRIKDIDSIRTVSVS